MGKPLFEEHMKYCVRCCIPETEQGVSFDELGTCQGCQNSEQKMHINWRERYEALSSILEEAKRRAGDNYDCIIPISGGKDSMFQLYVLTRIFKVKPLAVTFNHNWYSETGWYNLMNSLETFEVDHVMFTPNRGLVNRLAKRSTELIGDPCWHCHSGIATFTFNIAIGMSIPLMIYGESSAEGFGRASYFKPDNYDRSHFIRMSSKKTVDEVVCDEIPLKDLRIFQLPSQEAWDRGGLQWLHLGDYMFWDDERQTEFLRDHFGWKETQIENAYKCYKSAECVMPGMHDFTCYLKRGYGRATFQANLDVRNGLLTREEAFDVIENVDTVRPEALDYFLSITGQTEEEFYQVMRGHRMPKLRDADLPIKEKQAKNRERILPFPLQLIERIRGNVVSPRATSKTAKSALPPDERVQLDSFRDMSIGRMLDAIERGELTPADIAKTCIRQHEKHEERIMAFECFSSEKLMEQAQDCADRLSAGEPIRVLEAIPLGVKDVYNTKDFPTEMGSPLWKGFTPGNDARLVFNAKDGGAVIPGKTVTAEFAVHALNKTLNPHDPARTPGTSSSGSAAAVSVGMVPVALGTQTGSSIIRPASFCGVYGMKPSFGLLPRTGSLKTTDSLDTLGFFSVWYEDLIRLFEALRVRGDNYPVSNKALSDTVLQSPPVGRPWKVAFVKTYTWANVPDYARQDMLAFTNALDSLDGVEVVEVEQPGSMDKAHEIHETIYNKSLSYYFREEHKDAQYVSETMSRMIESGNKITNEAYRDALVAQQELARDMDEFLQGVDVMVSHSTAGSAPLRDVEEAADPGLMWTLTHLPVINAPVFSAPDGMPYGLQLSTRRFNDYKLFSFADMLVEKGLVPERSVPLTGIE